MSTKKKNKKQETKWIFFRLSVEGSAVNNKCNVPNLVFHPLPSGLSWQINKHLFGNTLPRHSSLNSDSCTPHHLQLVYSLCWRKLNTRANKERYTVRFLLECAVICKCSICRLSSHLMCRIFCRAEDCGSGKKRSRTYFKIQTDVVRHPSAFWNTAFDSLWRCFFFFFSFPSTVNNMVGKKVVILIFEQRERKIQLIMVDKSL